MTAAENATNAALEDASAIQGSGFVVEEMPTDHLLQIEVAADGDAAAAAAVDAQAPIAVAADADAASEVVLEVAPAELAPANADAERLDNNDATVLTLDRDSESAGEF